MFFWIVRFLGKVGASESDDDEDWMKSSSCFWLVSSSRRIGSLDLVLRFFEVPACSISG